MPVARRFYLIAWSTLLLSAASSQAELPVSGVGVPELSNFDDTMVNFMESRGIEAGTLAIMYQGEVVFHRGYGWQDREKTTPLPPNAMMRLASVTKPITAAAAHRLAAAGELDLQARAIDIGQPGGGIIQLEPFPSLGDPRLGDITIQDLLRHRGGWDRTQASDYTWQDPLVSYFMGVTTPPTIDMKVQYILGKPLVHDPGSTYAYSNEGYVILGEAIETVTGQDLVDVVHERVFDPINVPRREIELGRTLVENRNPREPWYQSNDGLTTNLFDLNGPEVPYPDGGWHHEARVANGGLIASTKAILAFLDEYQVSGDNIGVVRAGNEGAGWRWNHTGSQDGTNTLARQMGNGINYVVMFNERPESGTSYAAQIRTELDRLIAMTTEWPEPLQEPGDGDGDSWLTDEDIRAFMDALLAGDESTYSQLRPTGRYLAYDFDDDGLVTAADQAPFVDYMRWSGFSESELSILTVPETSTFLLSTAGALLISLWPLRRRSVQRPF